MNSRIVVLVVAAMLAAGGQSVMAAPDFEKSYAELTARVVSQPMNQSFEELLTLAWDNAMYEGPEWATYLGYPGMNDRWSDQSLAGIEQSHLLARLRMTALESIDRSELTEANQLNYDLFRRLLTKEIARQAFPDEYLPISHMGGIHESIASTLEIMPTSTVAECDDILKRLAGVPQLLDENITLAKEGVRLGVTPPAVTLMTVPDQILRQITADPAEAPMLRFLNDLGSSIPGAEVEKIRVGAFKIYLDAIDPALRRLHSYLVESYLPACRETIAWTDMPQGAAWYAHLVQHHTTTALTPGEIFEIGLSEVARIRAEMDVIIKATSFDGDYAEFCQFLRTDPRFFFDDAESLLKEYRDICKRADPELIKLFGKLPRLPYGVLPVPEYSQETQTTAYYQGGSLRSGRPGYFYANTYDLKSRPKWEMEALTLHEAVPGHHLQIALAQELEGLPEFRKNSWFTAYGEGWALYAESLGEPMGFYRDPYSKFGQLTYDMWRAIRLVVDPGMHAKGWSRQQAIDFFTENSCKTAHDIEVEIDRYIIWPGQALGYKIGQLRIRKIRAEAEEQLGDKFDLRAFHDELLGHGTMPLDVLEKTIATWVETQR